MRDSLGGIVITGEHITKEQAKIFFLLLLRTKREEERRKRKSRVKREREAREKRNKCNIPGGVMSC